MAGRKNCIICGSNIFEKRNPRNITYSKKYGKWITCGKECSKTYQRVYKYIYSIKIRKLLIKIKELNNGKKIN